MSDNPIPTVGVVIFKDTSVLLVKHTSHGGHLTNTYGLPAGRVELDPITHELLETIRHAAVREFHEETGYSVSEVDLIEFENNHYEASIPRNNGTVVRMTWTVFLAKKIYGEIHNSDETIPEWVDIADLPSLPLVANVENAIHAAWNSLKE